MRALFGFAAATLLLVCLPACGSDSSEEGAADKSGQDAGGAGDGGSLGDGEVADAGASSTSSDGSATSSSSSGGSDTGSSGSSSSGAADAGSSGASSSGAADAGTGPKCGDGKCDVPAEDLTTCPKDCAGGADCGDGTCAGVQENGFTCPKDCKVDTGSIVACIMGKCTADVLKCMTDSGCAQALGCIQGCKADLLCMAQCGTKLTPSAQKILTDIVQCGGNQGCFGYGGTGKVCGDGKCDPGENLLNCSKDCELPVCGDGKCEFPAENQWFCAKDCKPAKCGDGKCEQLENPWTCAKDCVPGTCGNGQCDKPAETLVNCAKDCQPGNAQSNCIAGKCGKEGAACGGDVKCLGAMTCTASCTDKACFTKCGDALSGGSKLLFGVFAKCADANQCLK